MKVGNLVPCTPTIKVFIESIIFFHMDASKIDHKKQAQISNFFEFLLVNIIETILTMFDTFAVFVLLDFSV